jgi:hypothetical protein
MLQATNLYRKRLREQENTNKLSNFAAIVQTNQLKKFVGEGNLTEE